MSFINHRLNKIYINYDQKLENEVEKSDINKIRFRDFIFDKFVMVFDGAFEAQVAFEGCSGKGTAKIRRIDDENIDHHVFSWNLVKYKYSDELASKNECKCFDYNKDVYKKLDKADDFQIGAELLLILWYCRYIMTAKRERIKRLKLPSVEQEGEKAETELRKHLDKKYFLLEEIIEYVNEKGEKVSLNKTGRTMMCDCWSVRGHYRHYKNGKTVFIKSYLKGKKRNSEIPKSKKYYVQDSSGIDSEWSLN